MLKGVKQKMNLEEEAFNTLNDLFDKLNKVFLLKFIIYTNI